MTPTSALDLYNGESSFAKTKTNSDVAKPRAGGASYDWGRSSNTDWEVHVMICKNEDHSLERRLIIEIIILVYFRARVAIGGGADNGAGQVFLALRILTKI